MVVTRSVTAVSWCGPVQLNLRFPIRGHRCSKVQNQTTYLERLALASKISSNTLEIIELHPGEDGFIILEQSANHIGI